MLSFSRLMQQSLLLSACICSATCLLLNKEEKTNMAVSEHRLQFHIGNSSELWVNLTLYFYPGPALYGIVEEQTVNLTFDYSLESSVDLRATFYTEDTSVAELLQLNNWTLPLRREHVVNRWLADAPGNWSDQLPNLLQLRGIFLGRTHLSLRLTTTEGNGTLVIPVGDNLQYRLSVVRYMRAVDMIFRIVVWVFVLFANVGIGCEIDLNVVKHVLRRPVAPIIGLVSQYLFMPLISFCVLLVIDIPASTALGYFGIGCAPGGGASNFYCLLLGGDVSLSITMTLLSTIVALGMVPMYMFTLGQQVLKSRKIDINIIRELGSG